MIRSFFVGLFLLMNYMIQGQTFELQSGDILFREHSSSALSEAINQVTQVDRNHHFSHMGLVSIEDGELLVIHSEPEKGVVKEGLNEFFKIKDSLQVRVFAYRLLDEYQYAIKPAIELANTYIGQPYNFTYIIEDDGVYCSELVYLSFQSAQVFDLEPMTFKDPNSGEFPDAWIEHYKKLRIDIPEGLPGCNPNGMASSNKLIELGELPNN